MTFFDFILTDAIKTNLKVKTRDDAIHESLLALAKAGGFEDSAVDDLFNAILRREQLGSTGVGNGVAVPHAKHGSVERLVGSIVTVENGVDFESLDNEPVHLIITLVAPLDRPGEYLRTLDYVTSRLRNNELVHLLKQVNDSSEVVELLRQSDYETSVD